MYDKSHVTYFGEILRYFGRAIVFTIAALYFLIDLIFFTIVRPLGRRLAALSWVSRVLTWVGTLNRYTALIVLLVPWLALEPIKPIGVVLFTHHHHLAATLLVIVGEIVKLTAFERLFDAAKPKLMGFPWFAWGYGKWQAFTDYMHGHNLPLPPTCVKASNVRRPSWMRWAGR